MKYLIFIFLLVSTSVLAENTYNYKILKVVDGDTIHITAPYLPIELGDKIGLRIRGIDTPEMRGKCLDEIQKAKDAKKYLVSLVESKPYTIIIQGRDKYFRVLGDIKIGDEYVSNMMIEKGYARKYNGGTKQTWCK